ncbi:zinc ribbon domain-containing protein [Hamadaea sp.]|uniref:zinc ribbon domain-containing protein n=1 Tax=Hamadaea sp. TaxID=2024425 RepID=UPI0025BC5455|nr:zinc ribbon domain-containing protein [Hamadaea sp.]
MSRSTAADLRLVSATCVHGDSAGSACVTALTLRCGLRQQGVAPALEAQAFDSGQVEAITSQRCSACGRLDGPKPLSVRTWTCLCGVTHDRDLNAALNVLAQGSWDKSNARGAQVRPVPVPAPRCEAGFRPGPARETARGGGDFRPPGWKERQEVKSAFVVVAAVIGWPSRASSITSAPMFQASSSPR